ncbi:hypothetical protein MPLSOD_20193 [Mesorhizobium sp. SOD10]|nr:hypothetical protein MPLSOD_20193 [Mesorhizobium sp. SOD10]
MRERQAMAAMGTLRKDIGDSHPDVRLDWTFRPLFETLPIQAQRNARDRQGFREAKAPVFLATSFLNDMAMNSAHECGPAEETPISARTA